MPDKTDADVDSDVQAFTSQQSIFIAALFRGERVVAGAHLAHVRKPTPHHQRRIGQVAHDYDDLKGTVAGSPLVGPEADQDRGKGGDHVEREADNKEAQVQLVHVMRWEARVLTLRTGFDRVIDTLRREALLLQCWLQS